VPAAATAGFCWPIAATGIFVLQSKQNVAPSAIPTLQFGQFTVGASGLE